MVSEEFKLVEAQRWAIGIFIILFDPAFPPLDIFSYRSTQECGKGHIYKVIRAALLIVAKNWKSPKCPSTGGDFNKLGNMHTLDCHTLVRLYAVKWGLPKLSIFVSEKGKVQSSVYEKPVCV